MQSYNYAIHLLKEGHTVRMKALGYSMIPSICHEEVIYMKPFDINKDTIHLYDVILCEVDGQTILHRVMDLDGVIKIKGDNTSHYHEVLREHIYGVYVGVTYMIRSYIQQTLMPNVSLHRLKRHNLEGIYQDERSLNQAYLMTQQKDEVSRVLHVLTKTHKEILLLKGYALLDIYEYKPYLRAKGDLDVYVSHSHKEIGDILLSLGYTVKNRSRSHDVYFNGLLHIEVHMRLDEDFKISQNMLIHDLKTSCFIFKHKYQLIYLLLHMKKHLKHGGIGYKHILDIYYLKSYVDMSLLNHHKVDVLFRYIEGLMDFMLGHKVSRDIDMSYLLQFQKDIETYGAHGNLRIRMSRLKDISPLYKRYIHKEGLKALIETFKHNTVFSIIKKLKIYMTSKKVLSRDMLYKELGL